MILVEDCPRGLHVDVIGGFRVPRQRHEPIEIRTYDAVFGAGLWHFRKPVELAVGGLFDVFGHTRGIDLRPQLVGLGLLRVYLAKLFLDGAQLLTQIEFALVLLHLALNIALDLVAELDDFELFGQQQGQLAHPLCGIAFFEQGLTVGRLEAHRRGDEIGQHHRIGDVGDLHLHLARRLRQIGKQLLKEPGEIALHRDEFFVFDGRVGELGVGRDHIGSDLRELLDLEYLLSGDDAAKRPVGDLEHFLDDADRADALHVVRTGLFDLAVPQNDQPDRLPFAQRLFDELDSRLLDDGERNDGVREKHRFLERQNADQIRGNDARAGFLGHVLRYVSSLP